MKIIIKNDISSRFLTFLHRFFMESLRVFSYDLENSWYYQKTTQNTPIRCESHAVQIYSEFWEMLGFIAWRFHICSVLPSSKRCSFSATRRSCADRCGSVTLHSLCLVTVRTVWNRLSNSRCFVPPLKILYLLR